jgi:DNA-binding NarL/FixJ family response regulator
LVGFFDGRSSITDALIRLNPEVVVVDDMQEARHALDRLHEVTEATPEAKPLLLTLRMEREWLDEAFNAGAEAIVSKTVHPVALGTLLREISQGNVVQRRQTVAPVASAEDCPLTERELQILRLVAEGYTNGRIARELWVTEQTVKFHLSNTYRKLGVANRTEASRYAHVHNLTARITSIGGAHEQRLAS